MSKAITLNENHLIKLLGYLKTTKNPKRNRLMVLFSFYGGLRVSEISNLKVGDILNNDGSIKDEIKLKPTQNKSNRFIYILINSKVEIENFFNSFPNHTSLIDYLFFFFFNKLKFSADSLTHRFKDFYIKCGFDNASSHSGRRTFITNLASKGVSVRVLMELANHRNISTTQRYIDINENMKKSAIELI